MIQVQIASQLTATGVDGVRWVLVEGANDDFSVANGCHVITTGFITTGAGVLVINTGTSRRYGSSCAR